MARPTTETSQMATSGLTWLDLTEVVVSETFLFDTIIVFLRVENDCINWITKDNVRECETYQNAD